MIAKKQDDSKIQELYNNNQNFKINICSHKCSINKYALSKNREYKVSQLSINTILSCLYPYCEILVL